MKTQMICPHDSALLAAEEAGARRCPACRRDYPVEDGVLRLLDRTDEFYEGTYENQVGFLPRSEALRHVWPLWLINSGYSWLARRHVPAGASVVELGCAGGVRYFGRRYRMTGCDVSFSSLKKIGNVYECLVQADASACIPLPDGSVDAVVSSYFWEHIPPGIKPRILSECSRILRPGGKIVFLYDVETKNPLIDHYKRIDRALYDRLFIEGDGHLGYQLPADNVALFRAAGFRVLEHRGMEKTVIQSPAVLQKLTEFGNAARKLLGWTEVLGRSPWYYLYAGLTRVTDAVVCPFLPEDWARIDLVVCEKEPPRA